MMSVVVVGLRELGSVRFLNSKKGKNWKNSNHGGDGDGGDDDDDDDAMAAMTRLRVQIG